MSTRRLKVSLVTETFPPEVNGVAMTLGKLATGLTERGHHVRLVRPRQKSESSGLPVVAFNQAAAGELIVPGCNGLLAAPGDTATFIAASSKIAHGLASFPRITCTDSVCHLNWERIHNEYAALLEAMTHHRAIALPAESAIGFAPD